MNKLKELWQHAVFRWCVYFTPPFIFWIAAGIGAFGHGNDKSYEFGGDNLPSILVVLVWVLIFVVPSVWVWRKPLVSFLNKKAEEE